MNNFENNDCAIECVADIASIILDSRPIEDVLKNLIDKIPELFPDDTKPGLRIKWNNKTDESPSFGNYDTTVSNEITVNGEKEAAIEINFQDLNSEKTEKYEKTLNQVSNILSVFFGKRAKMEHLKSQEEKTRDYCNKLEDYIFVIDAKGNIIDFNSNFQKCTGYTESELRTMNINNILSGYTDDISESALVRDATKNGSSSLEVEHTCGTGAKIPMCITCKPLDKSEAFICVAKDISETRKAESELHESERKYSTIVEKGNDSVVIVQNKEIKFANSKLLELSGHTRNEMVGNSLLKFISEQDHKKCIDWFANRNGNGNNSNIIDVNILTKDNEEIPTEINISIIEYEGDQAELLIIRDISERKHAQDLLLKEKEKMENYLDVVGSIIGIVNKDSEIIFVNKVGAETLGYPKEEILGKNWFDDFLPVSVREMTRKNFFKVMAGELTPPQYFENLLLTREGEERLIFWHDVPLEDENGNRIGMISSGEDITENRKMEAMLIDSEKNLKTIFNNVDDQIYIYRPYGKFIDVNMAVTHSTGYSREEMLEMTPGDLLKKEVQPLMEGYTRRIMKEKNVIYDMDHVRKDGTFLPLEMNSKLIEYKGEEAIISVARDITERKKAEERLKRYASELKQSNELKELFTDIIRHDLLTPASVIKGYTEELLLAVKDEKARFLATKVMENNERLIELLETATKLAKLQKDEDITFEKIDVVSLAKMVIDSFRAQLEESRQEIIVTGENQCISIVNPVIEEVFTNLISNAMKYSPEQSKIKVDFTDENKMWKVSVTDNGIGVPDKDKPLLFNRFHRVDKKGIKGTGLGLAIVKKIVELHGGSYGVDDNTDGQGSVFWITVKKA